MSALLTGHLTQIFRTPRSGRMTWDMIEADRRSRGLELDPRAPGNVAAHVEGKRTLPGYTAAQAAKARKTTMKACPCRLCALALNPPATFAEAARFGLNTIGAESRPATHDGASL